jgi:hypothetical protein
LDILASVLAAKANVDAKKLKGRVNFFNIIFYSNIKNLVEK